MHTNKLKQNIAETLSSQLDDVTPEEIQNWIEVPPDPDIGDLAVPCHRLSPIFRKDPKEISKELTENLPVPDGFEKHENRGPYLNFFIDQSAFINSVVNDIIKEGEEWGEIDVGKNEPVVIDYSSPNIAKPFSIGHLRSTAIGAALYRLYNTLGFEVTGVNHLGDWGTQCGKQILAYRKWGEEEELEEEGIYYLQDLYVRITNEIEENPDLQEEARNWFKKLESGDPEAEALWNKFRNISIEYLEHIYDRLGVHFDEYKGESFYKEMTDDVIEEAREAGVAEESEGALVIKFEEEEMPPFLLRKADGATLYSTRDLAAALYRHREYNTDRLLYVVATEQNLHFRQLFTALKRMGHDWVENSSHVGFGLVQFEGGKMSTRKGQVVLLEDILDRGIEKTRDIMQDRPFPDEEKKKKAEAIGIGAVLFSDLKDNRTRNINFDWDQAIGYDQSTDSFRGETGPYLQYTHVRLCGIKREYDKEVPTSVDTTPLSLPEEFELVKKIAGYPDVLIESCKTNKPSIIANFLIELAQMFNTYYHDREKHQVISEDRELTRARVSLCESIRIVLASGLEILGLKPLKKM